MDNYTQPQQPVGPAPITPGTPQKSSNHTALIVIIVVLVVVILPLIAVFVFVGSIASIFSSIEGDVTSSYKMVCTKSGSNVLTLYYNDTQLTGYAANGMTFDFEKARSTAAQMGINSYIRSQADTMEKSYLATCKINGIDYSDDDDDVTYTPTTPSTPSTPSQPSAPAGVSTQTIGTDSFGYVDVPSNWAKFYDPSAPSTYQYAYGLNIITMMSYPDSTATASEMASNLYAKLGTESGVTSRLSSYATVGQDKYTANYIKAVYDDGTDLYIYIFKANDGVVHYLSIEGSASQLSEEEWIIDSFRLTK